MLVKLVATLTVLVANVVICVCILLLYQLINQVTFIYINSNGICLLVQQSCHFWSFEA